ncbi:MAG TPA: phenylalanine 4-monooxygenase [Caulobacteraceae bacterium]|jgi:phenylalanine-4-hydroxylase
MASAPAIRPAGVAEDWTVPQDWAAYTPAEHALWDRLFARQARQLAHRAHPAFLKGLDALHLSKPGIPDFAELSERLTRATGWRVVAVPGLVPDEVFFAHLARREFVAGRFLRRPDQIDYLQEPDVFHDLFGHVPLLSDPVFADYMQAYGEGALRAARLGATHRLARLYWHTVEFGLIDTDAGLRLYGAGIVSSHEESRYALDDPRPARLAFDMRRVMRTRYRIDDLQAAYFVIPSFEALLKQTLETDFAPLYAALERESDIEPGVILPTDRLLPVPEPR